VGLFSKLFGSSNVSSDREQVKPVEYEGFFIYQEAQTESGQYRIAGRITKEINGELCEHKFIRSDVVSSRQDADDLMLSKAKLFIDQMRDDIF